MIAEARSLENVKFLYESEVDEILGDKTVNAVSLKKKMVLLNRSR